MISMDLVVSNVRCCRPPTTCCPCFTPPVGGELVARDFAARPLQPTAATLPEWEQARALASTFWQRAAADVRVYDGFRVIAADNLRLIGC
jgi:hypothetical protein